MKIEVALGIIAGFCIYNCAAANAKNVCPPGVPLVQCFVAPCLFAGECANYANAKCVDDYCGGCHARFFVGQIDVTDLCVPARKIRFYYYILSSRRCNLVCPPNKPLVYCFVSPCAVTQCPRYPNAVCIDDYCGGCNARFFVKSREVTRKCAAAN